MPWVKPGTFRVQSMYPVRKTQQYPCFASSLLFYFASNYLLMAVIAILRCTEDRCEIWLAWFIAMKIKHR